MVTQSCIYQGSADFSFFYSLKKKQSTEGGVNVDFIDFPYTKIH